MLENLPARFDRHRFAVEYIGRGQTVLEGRKQPGPYALFRRTRKRWKYVFSHESVYMLVLQGKACLREMGLSDQKVLVSHGCEFILEIETRHFQLQHKLSQ